jgi:microsomal epoxide hydrolase
MTPFTVAVPDEVLDDLRERLARTRWPVAVEGVGWDRGTDPAYLRELVAYWQDGYDWRAWRPS